jgi:hypothetical protein
MNLYEVWYKDWLSGNLYPYLIEADSPENAMKQVYEIAPGCAGGIEFITEN